MHTPDFRPFQINLLFLGPDRPKILSDQVEKTKIVQLKIKDDN